MLWALLDVMTIMVLVTGVYLWMRRRKSGVSVERAIARPAAIEASVAAS